MSQIIANSTKNERIHLENKRGFCPRCNPPSGIIITYYPKINKSEIMCHDCDYKDVIEGDATYLLG